LLQLPHDLRGDHHASGTSDLHDEMLSKLTYTMAAMSDLEFGLGIAQSATEYGVDGFSAPQVMAFALELLEERYSDQR
jgi:hypothetical protein